MRSAVLVTFVLDILMFPVWWYSRGLLMVFKSAAQAVEGYAKYFAIGVWLKNLFVPMFGQRDWQSRIISVFMRLVQIIGRSIGLLIVTVVVVIVVLLYVAAPLIVGLFAVHHILGSLLYAS